MLEVQIFETVQKVLQIQVANLKANFSEYFLHDLADLKIPEMRGRFVRNLDELGRQVAHLGLRGDRGDTSGVIKPLHHQITILTVPDLAKLALKIILNQN